MSSIDRPKVAPVDALGSEIQAALREDKARGGKLLWSYSRGGFFEFDGYCAVASSAYFFLAGEAAADLDPAAGADKVDWEAAGQAALASGLQPMQLTLRQRWPHHGESRHWWIARPSEGVVVDLTIGPADRPDRDYPYERGRRRGFMQHGYRRPNRTRALVLIEAVKRARVSPGGR